MREIRKFFVVAVLLFAGVLVGTTDAMQKQVVPKSGHYAGYDADGNHIGLNYYPGHGVTHVRINYEYDIGGARVDANAHWPVTCHHGYCTWGHWYNANKVIGHWRPPHSTHAISFTAYWMRNPNHVTERR